jgi:hypothetical protein
VRAFKFLLGGRVSPFAGAIWPEDGWVDADAPLEECRHGVHACYAEDLAWWLNDELWEVELEGDIRDGRFKVLASRGRLTRRIDGWNDGARRGFAAACAARAAGHAEAARRAGIDSARRIAAYAEEAAGAVGTETVAMTAYVAAHAAGARTDLADDPFAAERLEQSRWLARRLGLSADGA